MEKITLNKIKDIGKFTCNIYHLNEMTRKINDNPSRVYEIMETYGSLPDSVTRETIFGYIADKYRSGNYDLVYNAWLQL